MRVLLYTENYVKGGGNLYFTDLVRGVQKCGNEWIVCSNPHGLFPNDIDRIGREPLTVSIFSRGAIRSRKNKHASLTRLLSRLMIPLSPILMLFNIFIFSRLLKKHRPDLVISANGGYPAATSTLHLVFASRIRRIPAFLSVVSTPAPRRRFLRLYDSMIDIFVSFSVNSIIVNSMKQSKAMTELRGLDQKKMICLYNALQPLPANESPAKDFSMQKLLRMVYIGRVESAKGIYVLIEAMARAKNAKLQLDIIGDGEDSNAAKQRAFELGLDDKINFRGFVPKLITEILAGYDILVLPSLWEGLPYVILEAMRSGLPVIASNIGGIPEAVFQNKTGWLVEPGNVEQLAETIDIAARDRQILQHMSAHASETFSNRFSIEVFNQQLCALIRETA